MDRITFRVDVKTKEKLDRYCEQTGNKMGEAIRILLGEALHDENKKTTADTVSQSSPHPKLFINERRAIRGTIECTLMLRKLCEFTFKSDNFLSEIDEQTTKKLSDGWHNDYNG